MDRSTLASTSSRLRQSLLLTTALAVTACGPYRETELQKAVKAHDATAVKRLLEAGAPLESSWAELLPPGRLAIVNVTPHEPESIEVLRLLTAAAPNVDEFLHQSFSLNCRKTPCHRPTTVEHVSRHRSIEAVQVLIDAGLNLRTQGVTNALVYAIAEDDDAMARFFVEAGAAVDGWADAQSNRFVDSISVLEAARRKENVALVDWLVAKGAR